MRESDDTRNPKPLVQRDDAKPRAAWERPELSKQSIVAITQKSGMPNDVMHGRADPAS